MNKILTLTIGALLLSFASFAIFPISGTFGTCVGSSVNLYDSTGGGTWSSSNTAVATVSSTFYPHWESITGVSAGVATITYDIGGGVYATASFTVTATPPSVTGVTSFCAGTTSTLSDATPGGIWSSGSTMIATVGAGTGAVTGITGGFVWISYTVGPGCSALTAVTVSATSAGMLSGDSLVCVGSTIATLSDVVSGGAWSSANTLIATVGVSSGIISGVSPGTTTISYTFTDACGTATSSVPVYVSNTTIPGTISTLLPVYVSGTAYLSVYPGTYGGTWSSGNTSIATVSGNILTGVSPGTATITYSVTGCGGPGYSTTVATIIPLNSISGNVLFTGLPYSGPVKVWLITYDPSTSDLEALDSVTVYSTGSSVLYNFISEPTDSFRIKAAVPDTPSHPLYAPTYHGSYFYWYSADVLYHTTISNDVGQDITMLYGTPPTGSGFIAGNVTSGANKGTSGSAAVANMRIYVLNSSGAIVAQTTTDVSGNYGFSNLPFGAYAIFPEALNYLTTAYTGVNVTSSAITVSGANFIQHTLSHTITPVYAGVGSVANNAASLFVFPNPSNGKLNVQWNTTATEKGAVTISDVTGRQVFTTTVNMNEGTGISQVDLSGLTNGLYIISVKSASINYNNKIEIQK